MASPQRALGAEDLVLCSGTLIEASLREMAEAAAAGGFQAISLWPQDVERARSEGLDDTEIRALLADHGLAVAELDPLLSWLGSGDLGSGAASGADAMLARGEQEFYALADAFGARSLNLAHPFPGEVDLDAAAAAFAGVCDRARERGLDAVLEFLPWTGIPDAASAAEIVRRAGRSNGGIMVDTWHHFRGSQDDAQLRALDAAMVKGVQINSCPSEPLGNPMVESMESRMLPGEGAIDCVGIVRILDSIGSRAPIGVEVFSSELNALPPVEVGKRCGEAARRVLARARTG